MRTQLVHLLDEDADLGRDLGAVAGSSARSALVAPVDVLERGVWQPRESRSDARPRAFLVLDGCVARSVFISGASCTELLGAGDLVQPSATAEGEPSIPAAIEWHVLERARVALLDESFLAAAACWPAVSARLTARALRRADVLAEHLAITCLPRLELRLHVLFWHLADRFGRVNGRGVVVPVRLTHEMLARLVGARRPSVTTALGRLREEGLVFARDEGWVLLGDPPSENARSSSGVRVLTSPVSGRARRGTPIE